MSPGLWIAILRKHGPVATIAVFLVLFLAGIVNAALTDTRASLTTLQQQHLELRFYMHAICLGVTPADRAIATCTYVGPDAAAGH
jgi:hypothetical protein